MVSHNNTQNLLYHTIVKENILSSKITIARNLPTHAHH